MMELYIGGFAQGKLDYVKRKLSGEKCLVIDGQMFPLEEPWSVSEEEEQPVFDRFHLWVRRLIEHGMDAEEAVRKLTGQYPKLWIISDEVGNGIVPLEASEREYRERLGRILTAIAAESEHVERVICGIGQILK